MEPLPAEVNDDEAATQAQRRKASKAASQRCWLGRTENRDYFRAGADMCNTFTIAMAATARYEKAGTKPV